MQALARCSAIFFFFFSSRRRHTRCSRDWSSDVCSSDLQGIRQMVTKLALGGSKGKMLSSVANYLYRNRSRMHYDQYLARGLPIASGSVEGACKNLIKDRMERSGMRWTEAMAEAIVKLRDRKSVV